MKQETRDRVICCLMAFILLTMGMCVETTTADSSFSRVSECTSESICAMSYISEQVEPCTTDMLGKRAVSFRSDLGRTANRTQNRTQSKAILICTTVGTILQGLLYYQRTEYKEDGQLLLNRAVAVNYIHQKDGGE